MRRFFVDDISAGAASVEIRGEEFIHLKKVLRLGPGSEVSIFNGRGLEFKGVIKKVGRSSALVSVSGKILSTTESPVPITLIQGLVKATKPELVVQKSVELGLAGIVFYTAARSVVVTKGRTEKKLERLKKVAVGAAKQCGRSVLPSLEIAGSLAEAVSKDFPENTLKIILMERGPARGLKEVLSGKSGLMDVAVLVGPEGGFTAEEAREARSRGFMPAALGPRVLRSETAALASAAIIQYELGDMGRTLAKPDS